MKICVDVNKWQSKIIHQSRNRICSKIQISNGRVTLISLQAGCCENIKLTRNLLALGFNFLLARVCFSSRCFARFSFCLTCDETSLSTTRTDLEMSEVDLRYVKHSNLNIATNSKTKKNLLNANLYLVSERYYLSKKFFCRLWFMLSVLALSFTQCIRTLQVNAITRMYFKFLLSFKIKSINGFV